ncbi:MAG: hypothetical protein AAF889_05415, partial [Cyanobacteria bacterium P01_D01_bin.73]
NTYLAFTNYAISLRSRFVDAISYSFSLVHGQWGKVFSRLFALSLIGAGINFMANMASGIIDAILTPILPVTAAITGLISVFISYAWTITFVVMFLHFDYIRNPRIQVGQQKKQN